MTGRLCITIAAAVLAAALSFAAVAAAGFEAPSKYKRIGLESGVVTIPLAELGSGRVRYYELEDTGIKFFTYMGEDGVIVTAFDACKLCYGQHQGFSQNSALAVCNSCGKKTLISALREFGHDCSPIALPHNVAGDNLTIESAAFLAGARYF